MIKIFIYRLTNKVTYYMGQIAGDKHVTTGLSAAAFLFASMAQFMENYQ